MANTSKKKKAEKTEVITNCDKSNKVVAKCDHPEEPVTNCDQLENVTEITPDRFLITDGDVYLLGASVKDMGIGLCAITKMQTTPETILGLLKYNSSSSRDDTYEG